MPTRTLRASARERACCFLVARCFTTVALVATMFIAVTPQAASAAPTSRQACSSGIGVGSNNAARAGNGCVFIEYGELFETFNYTGSAQQWTVPSGVTSLEGMRYMVTALIVQ